MLDNVNTISANWCAGMKDTSQWRKTVQVLEVTPGKKVVWALRSWDGANDLGPSSSIQLLDQKGLMEKFELQEMEVLEMPKTTNNLVFLTLLGNGQLKIY